MKSARLRCTMLLVASSFVLALLLLPTPQKTRTRMSRSLALLVVPAAAWHMQAQGAETPYPKMAPLDQYLMERDAEIGLARSAAPESISRDAEVLVLGRHGYETGVKGKNGFVCMVERSWISPIDDPDFWNPKGRAPICFNAAAVRSYLPRVMRKTELLLAGSTKARMIETIKAAIDNKELPAMELGAMCYMLSKQGYLSDRVGHWHPHLMFFYSKGDPATWGAGLPGSPILAFDDTWEHLVTLLIPVPEWSDGTADPVASETADNWRLTSVRFFFAKIRVNKSHARFAPGKESQSAQANSRASIN